VFFFFFFYMKKLDISALEQEEIKKKRKSPPYKIYNNTKPLTCLIQYKCKQLASQEKKNKQTKTRDKQGVLQYNQLAPRNNHHS